MLRRQDLGHARLLPRAAFQDGASTRAFMMALNVSKGREDTRVLAINIRVILFLSNRFQRA